jgi:hypothetical protein
MNSPAFLADEMYRSERSGSNLEMAADVRAKAPIAIPFQPTTILSSRAGLTRSVSRCALSLCLLSLIILTISCSNMPNWVARLFGVDTIDSTF